MVPIVALTASAVALRPIGGHHVTTAGAPQPIGTWHLASTPPIDLSSQVRTATLSTGELLVVSGSFDVDMPVHKFESALYDAGTGQWTRLADAPVSPPAGGADLLVAGDRLVLLTHDDAGEVSLALFDGRSRQWRAIAMPSDPNHVFEGWAWNGATLVLARFGYTPYGDPSEPAAVERWDADTNTWREGAAPPAAARFTPTIARTNDRLAFWGGYTFDQSAVGSVPMPLVAGAPTTAGNRHDPARRAFTDGAIYDIAHDTWTYLPPQSSLTTMATNSPAGILTSSTLTLVSSPINDSTRLAARYENGAWHPLPSPSEEQRRPLAAGLEPIHDHRGQRFGTDADAVHRRHERHLALGTRLRAHVGPDRPDLDLGDDGRSGRYPVLRVATRRRGLDPGGAGSVRQSDGTGDRRDRQSGTGDRWRERPQPRSAARRVGARPPARARRAPMRSLPDDHVQHPRAGARLPLTGRVAGAGRFREVGGSGAPGPERSSAS